MPERKNIKTVASFAPATTRSPILIKRDVKTGIRQQDQDKDLPCLCSACMKSFTIPLGEDRPEDKRLPADSFVSAYNRYNSNYIKNAATLLNGSAADPKCPDCGNEGAYMFTGSHNASFITQQRHTVETQETEGKRPVITDTVILDCVYNYSNKKPVPIQLRLSNVYDMENHTVKQVIAGTCLDKTAGIDDFVQTRDHLNIFTQRPFADMASNVKYGVRHLEDPSATNRRHSPAHVLIESANFAEDDSIPSVYKLAVGSAYERSSFSVTALYKDENGEYDGEMLTVQQILDVANLEPFATYTGEAAKGMPKERPDVKRASEDAKDANVEILVRMAQEYLPPERMDVMRAYLEANPAGHQQLMQMFTRYPAAAAFASERAEAKIMDYFYAQKRKQKDDPSYEIKEMTGKGKVRMYREAFNLTLNELCSADNNITKLCGVKVPQGTDGAKCLKDALRFPVFGDEKGKNAVPAQMLTKEGTVPENNAASTKAIKQRFDAKPISTANNIYTARKLGILDADALNLINQLADEYPDTEPKRTYQHGMRGMKPARSNCVACAGCIAPIEDAKQLSFIKCFLKTRSRKSALDEMYGASLRTPNDKMAGYYLICETTDLYANAMGWASFDRIEHDADETAEHITPEQQIRSYLMYNRIQDAYKDFAFMLKDETWETVNKVAREIMEEHRAAVARQETPAAEDETTAPAPAENTEHKKQYLTTTTDTPLFHKRNLRGIHDELSIMAKKEIVSLEPIKYSPHDRELEASYDAPDGSGKWSFHLMKDEPDFIRTASVLHNCVGGGTYRDRTRSGACRILYMQDENKRRVACIELTPSGKDWRLQQFQSDHDDALPEKYVEVATQWMDEHNISYQSCADYRRFGKTTNMTVDYHQNEIDEVTGKVVTPKQWELLSSKRYAAAVEVYGLNADEQLNVPSVPDDLLDFE